MAFFQSFSLPDLQPWMLMVLFAASFFGTLVFVPWAVVRIPEDYFAYYNRHRKPWKNYHPALRYLLIAGKNLLGLVLFATGIAMLVLPGQGVLTIVIGILLVDFPGKYYVERWIVSRKPVLRAFNWLRRRADKLPLNLDR